MAKVVTDNQYYTAIANAIRTLVGSNRTYTPAEMAPAIIGYIAGGIDLSDIESYFITDVVNAMKYVKELGTDDWVHHIVTTDNHFPFNYGHSTAIVKAVQDTGYFSKVINLGDMADNHTTESYTASIENYGQFSGDLLYAVGNHEDFTDPYFFDNLLSDDTDLVLDSSDTYNYYWDDTNHKIRYIVYSWKYGATYAVNQLKNVPSDYSVITLCHYRNLIKLSCVVPIIGHQLNYIGNIDGHEHLDIYESSYGGQYNDMSLLNDGWINSETGYTKTDATNESQAITIMSINTSTKNVKFYRIGMPTALGQRWQYTYVQGGSLEYWERGYYWDASGALRANANSYYCTKLYPVSDGNDNPVNYRVYTESGTMTWVYAIGLDVNGDLVGRFSIATTDVWARRGFVSKVKFNSTVNSFLFAIDSGDVEKTDDIIVTSESMQLDRSYAEADWDTGYTLNSSGGNSVSETGATSYAFDILPNTTYRFYVDEAGWSTENMFAHLYSVDSATNMNTNVPVRLGRQGSGNAGTSEITFTTNANAAYCRITVGNIFGVVDNFKNKCHLEVVTA